MEKTQCTCETQFNLEVFERNRYFYGKLMTVRDFQCEQENIQKKRWLLNRLLFGSGIVCGLELLQSEEVQKKTSIKIGSGVVIDESGREVIVAETELFNLENLHVNPPSEIGSTKREIYLCIHAHDEVVEPVPALDATMCDREVCEYNKIRESHKFCWQEVSHEEKRESLYEDWFGVEHATVLDHPDFFVERIHPRTAVPGSTIDVLVKVVAKKDIPAVNLSETVLFSPPSSVAGHIEPFPTDSSAPPLDILQQFPTPFVGLHNGEYFVHVYQIKIPENKLSVQITGKLRYDTSSMRAERFELALPPSTLEVTALVDAKRKEDLKLYTISCSQEQANSCLKIGLLSLNFEKGKLQGFNILPFKPKKFEFNLERIEEILECVRQSISGNYHVLKPGQTLVTFKNARTSKPVPVGNQGAAGTDITYARGDHKHELALLPKGGLVFDKDALGVDRSSFITSGIATIAAEQGSLSVVTTNFPNANFIVQLYSFSETATEILYDTHSPGGLIISIAKTNNTTGTFQIKRSDAGKEFKVRWVAFRY